MRKTIFLLLLVIAACGTPRYVEPNFFEGNEGLVLTVHENSGNALYEGVSSILTLRVENVGATRVNYSFVKYDLTGDPFYVTVTDSDFKFEDGIGFLYGREIGYPFGDFIDIKHVVTAKPITGLRAQPQTQLFGSICYPYETLLADIVCVDSNSQNGNLQPQVCTATDQLYQDQGAPIAVTAIENRPSAVMANSADGGVLPIMQPTFVIQIQNVGGGTVVMPIEPDDSGVFAGTRVDAFPILNDSRASAMLSSYFYDKFVTKGLPAKNNPDLVEKMHNACTQRQTAYTNAVRVYATLSNSTLECEPEVVSMRDDVGFTTCRLPFDDDFKLYSPNYEATLQIRLAYMYKDSFDHDIEIIRRDVPNDGDLTIEEYEQTPGMIDSQQMCVFCSRNPTDPRCNWNNQFDQFPLACKFNPLAKSCNAVLDTRLEADVKEQDLVRVFNCQCEERQCNSRDVDCIRGNHLCPLGRVCCAESFQAQYERKNP